MDCEFTRVDDRFELTLERKLAHPVEKVWRVLTEPELLCQWFPCDVVGEWKVGADLQFIFRHGEGEGLSEEELRGKVLAVEPPHLLEFSWGQHHFRCQLTADGDGCHLRFTESLTDPSQGARNAAGWEMCFENTEAVLQGVEVALFVYEVWKTKFEKYVKKFEPEMGPQQGPPENHPGIEANQTDDTSRQ